MLILNPLSEEELDAICNAPHRLRSDIFGKAEAEYKKRKRELQRKHPGKYICIDAQSLAYVIGDNYDQAMNQHYGPVGHGGRHFYIDYIPR